MNIGRYLRGEDRHIGTSRTIKMNLDLKQKLAIRIAVNEQFKANVPYEQLVEEICQLRFRVAELQKANSDMGWRLYPESMGR